jgi:hypothetical protein
MSKLDSRTEDEKQSDAEHECMVALETRSWRMRRDALESQMVHEEEYVIRRAIRRDIGACDRALMELAAGRLPEVR